MAWKLYKKKEKEKRSVSRHKQFIKKDVPPSTSCLTTGACDPLLQFYEFS
jgi:hypothetical protein